MIQSDDDHILTGSVKGVEAHMFATTAKQVSRHKTLDTMEIGLITDGQLQVYNGVGDSMRKGLVDRLNRVFASRGIMTSDVRRMGYFISHFGLPGSDGVAADVAADYEIFQSLLTKWARENHRVVGFAAHFDEFISDGSGLKPFHVHVLYEREAEACDEPQEFIWRNLI